MPSRTEKIGESPWQQPRWKRSAGVALFAGILLVGTLGLSSIGLQQGMPWIAGPVSMLTNLIAGGLLAALYIAAAFGWGRGVAARVAGESPSRGFIQLGLGLSMMLWLSHALAVLGLLSDHGPLGTVAGPRVVAWAAIGVGLLIVGHQVVAGSMQPERWPVFPISACIWAPAIALSLVAACNPPGSLWASEYGGYDALSYHLQLPKEWSAGADGRLWPLAHNVYSFLPSYMESAFMHLGAMSPGSGGAVQRMVGGDSTWVYAAQFLHIATGVVAAMMVARLVSMLVQRAGGNPQVGRWSGLAAGGVLLGTPWTVVVGSLAYNDLAVVAMLAASLLVAFDGEVRPRARALAVGWMVGIACSAKPTALFMAAPVAGVALLAFLPRARWAGAIGFGSLAGVLAMVPWLIRNAVASDGNPVFPFATSLFGAGWWSPEQVATYTRAHLFDGSVADRLALLFDERGLGHAQWAIMPLLGVAGLVAVLTWSRTRTVGWVLTLGAVLQLLAWLTVSHLQSRFLLPLIVTWAVAFGVGVGSVAVRLGGARGGNKGLAGLAAIVLTLLPFCLVGWSVLRFAQQIGGEPNRLLIGGVGGLTGMSHWTRLEGASAAERAGFLADAPTPTVFLNLEHCGVGSESAGGASDRAARVGGDSAIYLLGDATPLYLLGAASLPEGAMAAPSDPSRVIYHTAWDASPLGDAIRADPRDQTAWARFLAARGIGRVLVNKSELHRLISRSGYYDRDVTIERLSAWLSAAQKNGLRSARRWPDGYELLEIVADPSGAGEGAR
ncbi:MAG: hypothetical protein IT438_13605 [Phycisphaerales bacterium]|nr:hypothetical protein [Phycisphaerales bacterium]